MNPKKDTPKKRVVKKGYAIVSTRGKLSGEMIMGVERSMTVCAAIYLRKKNAQKRQSWVAHPENWRIVPCEITYILP